MPLFPKKSSRAALVAVAATTLVACAFLGSCTGTNAIATAPRGITIQPPAPSAEKPIDLKGVHNVVSYAPDVVCGGQPEGHEGLESLAAMGIRTIISVDGATPDVEGARSLGLRYVHLPISYDTVTPERQTQLAQALANCDGPIYVHCHHGKHRSSAAVGTALVGCGRLSPDDAAARMKVSGLAKDYTGLWQAVAEAKPLDASRLKADPASFPSICKVTGMVATMAEIDMVNDLLKQAGKAAWQAPADHPDLVAAKEAARLAALFAQLEKDPDSMRQPAEYQTLLKRSIDESAALDAAVRANEHAKADQLIQTLNKTCKECHKVWRDV